MNRKRILSFIMVMVMVFAMAATACGKKEEAAQKEEPKQEEASDADKEDVADVEEDAEAADEEEASADEVMKTGEDTLTEEDIQSLKDSIRDTVISEYLEPNNISVEDLTWPDEDSGEWGYMVALIESYNLAFVCGEEMDVSKVDSSSYSNPEIMEAVFNGVIYWLNKQGKYNDDYIGNVFSAVFPYDEVIPTIDFASK